MQFYSAATDTAGYRFIYATPQREYRFPVGTLTRNDDGTWTARVKHDEILDGRELVACKERHADALESVVLQYRKHAVEKNR